MPRNFDEEISHAQSSVTSVLGEMDAVQKSFIAACSDFLKDWYWQRVEEVVVKKPDVTKSLGKQRLTELKVDIRELQAATQKTVDQYLQNESFWWHLKPNKLTYYVNPFDGPKEINDALAQAAGTLGPVLERFGFESSQPDGHSEWRERPRNPASGTALPWTYSGRIKWSEGMSAPMRQYFNLHTRATQARAALDNLQSEKSSQEAADLWNSA